jgi:hypothetical protein
MDSVERLYDETLQSLAGQIQDARSSLENASQQLPDSKESQDRLREMQRTFEELEETLQRSGAETGGAVSDTLGVDEQDIPEVSRHAAGQVTDVLQSGDLLEETTNDAGQLVQRTIDSTGDIIETTLDETGNVVSEELVARLKDMTPSNEYTTENGFTVHEYTEDVGITIQLILDASGKVRGLQVVTDQANQDQQE